MKKFISILSAIFLLICNTASAIEVVRQKNVATYVTFPIVDVNGDVVVGAAGLDSEIDTFSDGSAPDGFTDMTNEATQIASTGIYYLSITQSEMNNDYIYITVKSSTTDSKDQHILIRTMVGDPLLVSSTDDGGVINVTGGAIDTATAVTNVVSANVTQWSGTNVATPDTAGYPKVTLKSGTGTGELSLSSGTVTVGTNSDKTGYSLTQSFPSNFADLAITASTGKITVGTNDDKSGYSISGTKTTLDALNDVSTAQVNSEVDTALGDYDAPTYTEMLNVARLMLRKDSAIATDLSSLVSAINADLSSGGGTFANTTDSQEAIRDNMGTAQTGDSYARLGAPAGASIAADIAAVKSETASILDDTGTSGVTVQELKVSALADLFNTDSGTTYGSAVSGSVVAEIADNAGGTALTEEGIAAAVWDSLTSAHTTSGTYGKLIADNLNATVSSRSSHSASDVWAVSTRALTELDEDNTTIDLNGSAVGSVVGAVGSVTGNVGGNLTGSIGSLATQAKADVNAEVDSALDTAIPGTPTSNSINERIKTLDDNYTSARAGNLDNLDEAISGIDDNPWDNATRTLTALDEDSTAIDLDGSTIGTVSNVSDKTGYALSASGIDAIWDEPQSGHAISGTFGKYLDAQVSLAAAPPTVDDIADAVWNEDISGNTNSGSFGEALNNASAGGDPWAVELPGSYTGDEAGNLIPALIKKSRGR